MSQTTAAAAPAPGTEAATAAKDVVPEATPAAVDLACWLWAAIPPRHDGRLDTTRAAAALGVTPGTLRRWVAHADELTLNDSGMRILRRRAVLRGRGHYLWPPLDDSSRARSAAALTYAEEAARVIRDEPAAMPAQWRSEAVLSPHRVHLLHYPAAHVFGLVHGRADAPAGTDRLGGGLREAVVVQTRQVAHRHAAVQLKQRALQLVDDARCIAPRELVRTGRTETWLEQAGDVELRRIRLKHTSRRS